MNMRKFFLGLAFLGCAFLVHADWVYRSSETVVLTNQVYHFTNAATTPLRVCAAYSLYTNTAATGTLNWYLWHDGITNLFLSSAVTAATNQTWTLSSFEGMYIPKNWVLLVEDTCGATNVFTIQLEGNL